MVKMKRKLLPRKMSKVRKINRTIFKKSKKSRVVQPDEEKSDTESETGFKSQNLDDTQSDDHNLHNAESDDEFNMSDELSDEDEELKSEKGIRKDEESETFGDSGDDAENGDEVIVHKEALAKLQETDPEFYKFLKDNDKKLLDFNLSDSDEENRDGGDPVHEPPEELELASDESDFEGDETESSDASVITLKMLKTWQNEIRTDKTNKTINCLMQAFHAAVLRVSSEEEQESSFYKVNGSSVFNGVIQICVLELGPAVRKYLGLVAGSKQPPHKCKKFVKIKTLLHSYFRDLLKIFGGVTSPNILNVLLKHLHYMAPMIVSFGNVTKPLLKKLTELWATSDESVRVVAFLCILRITSNQQQNLLEPVLKMMYMAYVKNSKFVSTSTLPGINFMMRSLVEMFAIDMNVAYQDVFLYVRQLAIHLRNAITVNKKENIQTVYNWQFVNSLRLWGNLLSATCNRSELKPLVYPFVQVCLGTIKLVPTPQYYPLRFHVVQILMDLSKNSGVFIPILPFILEVLTITDFNKKHQKVSIKPLQFTCLLRLSKSQLSENGFRDTVIETVYGQLLEYLSAWSHSIAFPDLSVFCVIQIKQFLKKCSVSSYCRKMRQLLEKIEQNNKFVLNERRNLTFDLKDSKKIDAWETTLRNKGTPITDFFETWDKVRQVKKNKQATGNEVLGEYNLPTLKKKDVKKKAEDGPVELFPSDSESEDGFKDKVKRKRGKRGGKNVNKRKVDLSEVNVEIDDDGEKDIVEDAKASDW